MTIGKQIRQARENKNLSQEELALKLGVSRQAVSKWENNSAVPQGLNREMLSQILELDFSVSETAPDRRRNKVSWLGWWLAIVLLCVSAGIGLQLISIRKNTSSDNARHEADGELLTSAIKRVEFYDKDQNIVRDVALWYNAAEINSILIQWEGGTPGSIKVFYTPSGTETQEQTELLMTKSIPDGDTVALLSAHALEEIIQGHIYFELDFGETIVVSDLYNMMYAE